MSHLSFTYHYHRTENLSLTVMVKTVCHPRYSVSPMLPGFPFYRFYCLLCYRWLDVLVQVCCSNKISKWFINKRNLFLAVLEVGSWRLGGLHYRVKYLFQVADISLCPHMARRNRELSWAYFIRTLITFMRTLLCPAHLPKASLSFFFFFNPLILFFFILNIKKFIYFIYFL